MPRNSTMRLLIWGRSVGLSSMMSCLLLLFASVMLVSCDDPAAEEDEPTGVTFGYMISDEDESNTGGKAIYSFSVNSVSGLPSLIGQATDVPDRNVTAFAVSSSGRFLYTVTTRGLIYKYSILEDTGNLRTLEAPVDASPPNFVDFSFHSIALDPLEQFAYVMGTVTVPDPGPNQAATQPIFEIYSIDPETGTLKFLRATRESYTQLEFSNSGIYAYSANQVFSDDGFPTGILSVLNINRTTGALTKIGGFSFGGWLVGPFHPLAKDPTGNHLYVTTSAQIINCGTPDIPFWVQRGSIIHSYLVDRSTGLLTSSGAADNTAPEIMTWGAVHSSGNFIYSIAASDYHDCTQFTRVPAAIYSYYVDGNTGELHRTGTVEAGSGSLSMTVDPTGRFLYLLNSQNIYVYNIDPATGQLNVIGTPLSGALEIPLPGRPLSYPFYLVGF